VKAKSAIVKKIALVSVFSSLGVVLAPFSWFEFLGTRAYPGQHMINALLGVLVGPLWAAIAAFIIGTIRIGLGVGTIYAFPGGIPGGLVVGAVYWVLKRFRTSEKVRLISAFTEPIGTVFIGATLALYLVAPLVAPQVGIASWAGTGRPFELVADKGALLAFSLFAVGWALSSIAGCIIGFIVLSILNRAGINRGTLFGEK
jgi:energy coupling factor transporter S component ThiW